MESPVVRHAPLEGARTPTPALLPDFLAPLDHKYFISPRWRVRAFVGDVLVFEIGWISADDEERAIRYVRDMGFTDAVRYETEKVEEAPK